MLQHVLLHCQTSPCSIGGQFLGKLKVLCCSVSLSAILKTLHSKHFPLADVPNSIDFKLLRGATPIKCDIRIDRIAFLLRLIY